MLSLKSVFVHSPATKIVLSQWRLFTKKVAAGVRNPLSCAFPPCASPTKPCFEVKEILIERGAKDSLPMVKQFLHTQYFTREPAIVSLYIPLNSHYLSNLAEQYSRRDRWEAYEVDPRSRKKRLIGVLIASKKYPWEADIIENWAKRCCEPFSTHLFFRAHCLRSPNLFLKYRVPFIYDVDVLATAADVSGRGLAGFLLRYFVLFSMEMHFPLMQIVVTNQHVKALCKRANMTPEWTIKYENYMDYMSQPVFYPRHPHHDVSLYIRRLNPKESPVPDKLYWPELHQTYMDHFADKKNVC